jgi:hypothetical protein
MELPSVILRIDEPPHAQLLRQLCVFKILLFNRIARRAELSMLSSDEGRRRWPFFLAP